MSSDQQTLLIIDDEEIALKNLSHILKSKGYEVTAMQSSSEALKILHEREFDLILTDLKMEKVDGMDILQFVRENYPESEVIMITGYATVDSAINAMRSGAYHYIAKPYKIDEVRKVVKEALEKRSLKMENRQLREQLKTYKISAELITNDPQMKKLMDSARQVAATDSNVMLTGESGTGKELMARFIHQSSRRSRGALLSINCGAFTEELLTNEMFGHEKGAFTGAHEAKKGLIEMADGGTLFLDEVTEMSTSMQVKLLRAIQEKEVMRVGGTEVIPVNVRLVAATNRNLQAEVSSGHFRQDLYYRLNVVSLRIPPLAERKNDIPLLIQHFIRRYSRMMEKSVKGISQEVADILQQYDFPGNVRELENIIERGIALTSSDLIEVSHLPEDLQETTLLTFRRKQGAIPSLADQERAYIEWVMNKTENNKTEAAKALGIDRVSLWRKLKKFDLE
ncbi:MAG: sigma-54 dependent transcriptional regulator [Proteobacteria bacterium]|nr:sigma-54 dependent transcriptional regulator [Pseudomonadota bacterium]MBU1687985.1 sigma-54 dependent transcriptional regulator [Pseudomonadota bacterium]